MDDKHAFCQRTIKINVDTPTNIGDWVLYKNNQLIAFQKPPTIGVQADKTGDKSLLDLAEIYCKHPLHLIHRIDRPASGVVLFAKNSRALVAMNEQFKARKVKKNYLAVVKNKPEKEEGTLIHFLKKNQKLNRSNAFPEEIPGTKRAEMTYRLIKSIENYHLLEIELITGRHHQIRAQLAAINNPIKGDVKYGFRRGNRDRSIHLHSWKMSFQHPTTNEIVHLEAPIPEETVWQAFFEEK